MLYNLHTHTVRCGHAVGTDREYVEAAIEGGIKVLGFSDHCPQFFSRPDYYSYFRMMPELTEGYVYSVRKLADEYKNDIKILLGFETEYYPESFEKLLEFLKPYDIDYMIMGQHFVGNEHDADKYMDGGQYGKRYLSQYVSQVMEGLSTGAFTYIAHPDIAYHGDSGLFYRKKMGELCEFAKRHDIPLEYNMLGYENGKTYPNPAFWKIAAKTGNKVVLGFDAHDPQKLKTLKTYRACLKKLRALGLEPAELEQITIRKP